MSVRILTEHRPDLVSLLYVSQSRAQGPTDVRAIVDASRVRNADLGVTGALISSFGSFAQILEGPVAAVEELMARIRRDGRHDEVAVAHCRPIKQRLFRHWALAYWGPETDVEPRYGRGRAIYRAIMDARAGSGDRLVNIVSDFAF